MSERKNQVVLITGTTSGIGQGMLRHYHQRGADVICVNRRSLPEQELEFPRAHFYKLDIGCFKEVDAFLASLDTLSLRPDLFVLNAGISLPDNLAGNFDFEVFSEVMRTNLGGVLTFVSAARRLKMKNVVFLGISSVAIIVPNPGLFAYYLSKFGIRKGFQLLQKNDPENQYKFVVLGPIHTDIFQGYGGPVGFQLKLFNALAKEVGQLTPVLDRFAKSRKAVLYYPLRACLFYYCAALGLKIFPFFYVGTRALPVALKGKR